ncbi:MAG TPA: hypothetical protein VMU13_00475 [Candidatus Paceibacterota bacterium]|nr:hypothetical protein [Candidatus Paceibacterota bacterium]
MSRDKTIEDRQSKEKAALLEQLKKTPIVHIACEKAGVGRATYYRWRGEDAQFRKQADAALTEGEALITDMSESQLITLIKEKNFSAIHLWLRQHHPKYANRVEITERVSVSDDLTPEQKKIVEEALRLANLSSQEHNHG